MPGRDSHDAMRSFVDTYGLENVVQVPDGDDSELWTSFGVRGQPAWALVRADGTTEVGFGAISDDILREAAGA